MWKRNNTTENKDYKALYEEQLKINEQPRMDLRFATILWDDLYRRVMRENRELKMRCK